MDKFKIPSVPPTINKTIRFPSDVVEEVEKAIEGKNCTFSAFVIAAVRMALAGARGAAAVASCFGKTLKIIPIETLHFIRNHSVCQSFFDEIPAS